MRTPSSAVAYDISGSAHPAERQPVERCAGLGTPELVEQALDPVLDLVGELELDQRPPPAAARADRRTDLDPCRAGEGRAGDGCREDRGAGADGSADQP